MAAVGDEGAAEDHADDGHDEEKAGETTAPVGHLLQGLTDCAVFEWCTYSSHMPRFAKSCVRLISRLALISSFSMSQRLVCHTQRVLSQEPDSALRTLGQHMAAGFAAGVLAELIIQPLEQMDKVRVMGPSHLSENAGNVLNSGSFSHYHVHWTCEVWRPCAVCNTLTTA
jgi:hypothetical protein